MGKKISLPLASFDVHLENYQSLIKEFRKNNDISHLIDVLNNSCWTSDLTSKVFGEDYDALVLTDKSQKIVWVSDGFREMTGYSKKFATGKKPAFIQGKMTSLNIKKQIREELKTNQTFRGSLLNYKKNGQTYICQINILPIYNLDEKLEYFLAIEKEVPAAS